jgi:4-hydroxybenzoate polyprenyltransferase
MRPHRAPPQPDGAHELRSQLGRPAGALAAPVGSPAALGGAPATPRGALADPSQTAAAPSQTPADPSPAPTSPSATRPTTFGRLGVYLKEMYPVPARAGLCVVIFFEIYFLVVLANQTETGPLRVGGQEAIGALTVFAFLLTLRAADDLKDYETDRRLFPHRAVPSGRVKRRDLAVLLAVVDTPVAALNLIFMNNPAWFAFLAVYGTAMSLWFFAKAKIQNSLPLALVTHNPVQIVMNLYVISFACLKYGIPLVTWPNAAIVLTLYFPGLIWEIARKVRAPWDETDYVTYSKLFGVARPVRFILAVMALDLATTGYLVYQLYPWAVAAVALAYAWLVWQGMVFIRAPGKFSLVSRVQWYEYAAEGTVVALIGAYLMGWGV